MDQVREKFGARRSRPAGSTNDSRRASAPIAATSACSLTLSAMRDAPVRDEGVVGRAARQRDRDRTPPATSVTRHRAQCLQQGRLRVCRMRRRVDHADALAPPSPDRRRTSRARSSASPDTPCAYSGLEIEQCVRRRRALRATRGLRAASSGSSRLAIEIRIEVRRADRCRVMNLDLDSLGSDARRNAQHGAVRRRGA